MTQKKSVLALLFTGAVFFSIFACSSSTPSDSAPNSPPPTETGDPAPDFIYQCGKETFSSPALQPTTMNGQDAWFVDPASNFEERVMDIGPDACRGHGVWKLNNSTVTSGLADQPLSPSLSQSAGENTVRSVGGGDTFELRFFFRTVGGTADGSAFTLSLSPTSVDRHNYLRFLNDLDANGGFQLLALDGVQLNHSVSVATGLQRGTWHHLRLLVKNVDGPDNDIIQVYVDGTLVNTHTTWEAWRAAIPTPTLAVTRVLFRLNAAASSFGAFSAPNGFYIDDLSQKVYDSSDPSTVLVHYETGFETP